MRALFISLLMICICAAANAADDVYAQVDRNQVEMYQTFNYSIIQEGSRKGPQPDLSPLSKDFQVLATSSNSQMQIINGNVSQQIEWRVILSPKRVGKLEIPAIKVGSKTTKPISILATEESSQTSASAHSKDLFMEAEVSTDKPFVQQQVIYTVRILSLVSVHRASLEPPRVDNAIMQQLGQDVSYQATRQGKTYQVIERKYAIFPQQQGKLEIKAPIYAGMAQRQQDWQQRYQFDRVFAIQVQGEPVRVSVKPVTLTVKAKPGSFQGKWWLPAQNLTLSEEISDSGNQFQVGDPINRAVRIQAMGLTAEQLPTLSLVTPDGINAYPDKPINQNTVADGNVLGIREYKMAMIPTQPGTYKLPAIEIPWWNVKTNRAEVVKLAERTIEVVGAALAKEPKAPAEQSKETPVVPTTTEAEKASTMQAEPSVQKTNIWLWVAAGCASLWLLTIAFWWWSRRAPTKPSNEAKADKPAKERALKKALKAACQQNNPKQARLALIDWARARWPSANIIRLADIPSQTKAINEEFNRLDQALYSSHNDEWRQGDQLWQAILQLEKQAAQKQQSKNEQELPPLYME